MPVISVVVPTHHRPALLGQALASAREQTFTDYEIIVVSNGEGVRMQVASEETAAAFGCRYLCLRDGNVSVARNFGVAHSRGEWIAFLDDDDLWMPEKLERQLPCAAATGAGLIASTAIRFWPDGREEISPWRLPDGSDVLAAIHRGEWVATPSTVIVRKAAIAAAGGFDPCQRYCEDTDLWRRIAWRHAVHQMDEPLARHRKHDGGKSEHAAIAYYDLRHAVKAWRDTPADLRHTLPPVGALARRWLMRAVGLRRPALRREWRPEAP